MRHHCVLHYFFPSHFHSIFFAVIQLLGVLQCNSVSVLTMNNRTATTTNPTISGYDGQFCATRKLMESFANTLLSFTETDSLGGWPVASFNCGNFKHHLRRRGQDNLTYMRTIITTSRIPSAGVFKLFYKKYKTRN